MPDLNQDSLESQFKAQRGELRAKEAFTRRSRGTKASKSKSSKQADPNLAPLGIVLKSPEKVWEHPQVTPEETRVAEQFLRQEARTGGIATRTQKLARTPGTVENLGYEFDKIWQGHPTYGSDVNDKERADAMDIARRAIGPDGRVAPGVYAHVLDIARNRAHLPLGEPMQDWTNDPKNPRNEPTHTPLDLLGKVGHVLTVPAEAIGNIAAEGRKSFSTIPGMAIAGAATLSKGGTVADALRASGGAYQSLSKSMAEGDVNETLDGLSHMAGYFIPGVGQAAGVGMISQAGSHLAKGDIPAAIEAFVPVEAMAKTFDPGAKPSERAMGAVMIVMTALGGLHARDGIRSKKLLKEYAKELKARDARLGDAVDKVADSVSDKEVADAFQSVQSLYEDVPGRSTRGDVNPAQVLPENPPEVHVAPEVIPAPEGVQEAPQSVPVQEPIPTVETPQKVTGAVETPIQEPILETPVEAPKAEIPDTTLKHSEAQTYADELGAELPKGKRTWADALEEARRQNVSENWEEVIADSGSKRRPLSDVEKIGLAEKLHGLRQERTSIANKIADGTATDLDKARYDLLTDQGAKIYGAAFKAGSESGRSLNAQKAWLQGPMDDIHLTAKWTSRLGRDLKPAESAAIKELSERHAKLQSEFDDAIKRISKLEADKAVARSAPRARGTFSRTVTQDQAKEALRVLGSVVEPGQVGAGLGGVRIKWGEAESAALRTVVKYVYESLAETGIHSVDSIKENVRKLLPDKEIDDVTMHQAIREALGSEGRTINRGRLFGEDVATQGQWGLRDPEISKLRARLDTVKKDADVKLAAAIEDQKWAESKGMAKAYLVAKDVMQSARTLMTTLDDSAVGRQSFLIGLTNPRSWLKGVANHWKGLTHAGYEGVVNDIRASQLYEFGQQVGLKHRTIVGEEQYGGRLLQRIPGVKQIVNTSEMLFDLQTDWSVQHAFESVMKLVSGGKEPSIQEGKVFADFINNLSGKSNLNLKDAELLFFAPKFVWSRFKVLNAPLYIGKATKAGYQAGGIKQGAKAGAVMAYQYAKAGAALASLFAVAQAGGWKVGTDPDSADFGKIRKGKRVFDLTAGEGQMLKFCWDLYRSAANPKFYAGRPVSTSEEMMRFARKKLAPLPSAIATLADVSSEESLTKDYGMRLGKNIIGEDTDIGQEALRSSVPLNVSQQMGMDKENPSPEDRFWTLLMDGLGFASGYYDPGARKKAADEKRSSRRKGKESIDDILKRHIGN